MKNNNLKRLWLGEYTVPSDVMILYFCVLNENTVTKKDNYLYKIILYCISILLKKKKKTFTVLDPKSPGLKQWMDHAKETCAMGKLIEINRTRGLFLILGERTPCTRATTLIKVLSHRNRK